MSNISESPKNTDLIMKTIKWINDTFVPMGMKPIEDLPEAIPANGNTCVIARVLKNGFREFGDVQVGRHGIELFPTINISSPSELGNSVIASHLEWSNDMQAFEEISLPPYVSNFITEFDNGKIPELIDEDTVIEMMGECEAYQVLNVGKGCGCEYYGNYGEEC